MKSHDFWYDLQPIFVGESDEIQEIDLVNLDPTCLARCVHYILHHAKECSTEFLLTGTDQQVQFASPDIAVTYLVQGQVTLTIWLAFPALPMLSIYIDFATEMSFGYVQGTWDAMAVLTFFDLLYELKCICPQAQLRPSIYTYNTEEQELILEFWQDYDHLKT